MPRLGAADAIAGGQACSGHAFAISSFRRSVADAVLPFLTPLQWPVSLERRSPSSRDLCASAWMCMRASPASSNQGFLQSPA